MFSSILILVPFLAGINAANDWSVPCTSGTCSYDLPTTDSTAAGSLKIWGSPDAITDITTAAGWQILGCDSTALNQSIRLVCMDDPEDTNSNCGHLYQNTGAVNKLVRLPQNCGASAFARISDAWVPADQSIPASIQARIVRRDGTPPVVKALALDVNFSAVDYSKTGVVNIAIEGANAPQNSAPASRRMVRRALSPSNPTGAGTVVSGDTASGTVSAGNQSASAALEGNLVNVAGATGTLKLKPLALKKNVNLINTSVNCGPAAASLKVDMAANTNAQATISVTAKGTVVPPSIPTFQVVAGVTADIGGTVTVAAGLNGHLDSGVINLLTTGVPGLDFPGILTVGPIFKVDTQFVGDVQVPLAMTVGINFAVNNATLTFPSSASTSPSPSAFSVGDMPLTLNAEANVKATGTMTATLTPSLNLGVTALGNAASAQIFLSFDTSAALVMTLNAGVIANATTDVKSALAPAKSALPPVQSALPPVKSAVVPVAVPIATPVAAPVVKPVAAPVAEPVAAPVAKPVAAPVAKPVAAPVAEPVAAPVAKPVVAPVAKPVAAPVAKPVAAPVAKPVAAPVAKPVAAPVAKPVAAPVAKPVVKPVAKPVAAKPAKKLVAKDRSFEEDEEEVVQDDETPQEEEVDAFENTLVTRAAAASASFSGCVKVNTGIAVNVGASGTFFTVITKTTKAVLFTKNFTVFTKCFGVPAKPAAAAAKKARFARSTPRVSRLDRVRRAALSCPIGTTKPTLSPITSGTVSKSSIVSA
ncbi:hypothetical protein C8R46DRAFT_1351084 [Mycena filopes]|nr:hypothetical protein C8R46DRAFT_1351084 [Mycena filopes]